MVARLTPDQKVACSSHVGVKPAFFPLRLQGRVRSRGRVCYRRRRTQNPLFSLAPRTPGSQTRGSLRDGGWRRGAAGLRAAPREGTDPLPAPRSPAPGSSAGSASREPGHRRLQVCPQREPPPAGVPARGRGGVGEWVDGERCAQRRARRPRRHGAVVRAAFLTSSPLPRLASPRQVQGKEACPGAARGPERACCLCDPWVCARCAGSGSSHP